MILSATINFVIMMNVSAVLVVTSLIWEMDFVTNYVILITVSLIKEIVIMRNIAIINANLVC